MALKYNNFADAFDVMTDAFPDIKERMSWCWQNAQEAYSGASDPVDKTHFGMACYAIECLYFAYRYLVQDYWATWESSAFYNAMYYAGTGGGAAVDMAAIINAMLQATPEEIKYFVGLVDAFRMSIWNKPFNYEFYAALARGFI